MVGLLLAVPPVLFLMLCYVDDTWIVCYLFPGSCRAAHAHTSVVLLPGRENKCGTDLER